MNSGTITAYCAATLSTVLALAVVLRRRSVPAWFFAAGMIVLAGESVQGGLSLVEENPWKLLEQHKAALLFKSLVPFIWLAFSLTYLRGEYLRNLREWRIALIAALVIPTGLAFGFHDSLAAVKETPGGGWHIEYSQAATALQLTVLLATILVLMNLERTLRAAAGTARWKIKFAMMGLAVIFGARIYTRSQFLIFSDYDPHHIIIDCSALLVGGGLILVGLVRQGFASIDIYPSRAVLQSSVTLLLVGSYLFILGVLAQVAAAVGGLESFQFQAAIILAGVAALAILLLSDRLRQQVRLFVGRHFRRPQHDSLSLWRSMTQRLSSASDADVSCTEAVKLIAESFQVLSVTIWLHDETGNVLTPRASTVVPPPEATASGAHHAAAAPALEGLRNSHRPFDLDVPGADWVGLLREASRPHFSKGGTRLCIPLIAADRALGAITLVDRVNGVSYSTEELDLLQCIGDQVAASLLQFRLGEELMLGREMEAFQTMSTFFVHDLKNAASSLGLMLENLPGHFDDPEFRQDALRGMGATVSRINQIISRLRSLRNKLDLKLEATDLHQLVSGVLDSAGTSPGIAIKRDFKPVPPVIADQEQLHSVVTNLLVNAREAIEGEGEITVRIASMDGRATVSVSDTGSGMTPAFIRDSLFRPFCSTRKKGIGIGMFQCRIIMQAHNGSILVNSEPGKGSTFVVSIPLQPESA